MYDEEDNEPFLGRSMSRPAHGQSDDTARLIDEEVKDILDSCYQTAKTTLKRIWTNSCYGRLFDGIRNNRFKTNRSDHGG